jgi:hypothetical protein
MKYLKRFNENQNTSILQQLISTLEEKLDYDFDRDYDDVTCFMSYGENGTWPQLINSIYNIIKPDIDKSDFEEEIKTIIPQSFTIGYQDEDFIESVFMSGEDEDDRSQSNISINYQNIAETILKRFKLM